MTLTKARLGEFRGVGRDTSTTCTVWTVDIHRVRPPPKVSLQDLPKLPYRLGREGEWAHSGLME